MKVWLRRALRAAWRKACPARLNTAAFGPASVFPPEMCVGGASPSQEQKCRADGKRDRSGLRFPCVHAAANTPAKRPGAEFALFPSRSSLPRINGRVGLRITHFEDCSAFTHVAACTLAKSPKVTLYIEGFSHFVASMTAPIASGWSDSCRVGLSPTGRAPPFHGAR